MKNILWIFSTVCLVTALYQCAKDIDLSPPPQGIGYESFPVVPDDSLAHSDMGTVFQSSNPNMDSARLPQKLSGSKGPQRVYLIPYPRTASECTAAQLRTYLDTLGYVPAPLGYMNGTVRQYFASYFQRTMPRNFVCIESNLMTTINGVEQPLSTVLCSTQTSLGSVPLYWGGGPGFPIDRQFECVCLKK